TRPAQIVFTSGSTGRPKAVVQGWTELGLVTDMLVSHLGLTRADRILGASPVAHQTGFICNMLLSWRLGIPVVLQDVWDPARAAREAIGAHRVTYVQGATTFLIDLAAAYEHDATLPAPDSLRLFVTIGTPAPEPQLRRAAGVLNAAVLAAYGSSEICLGTVSSPSDPPEWAWGSAGRPMPGVELRIVDGRGRPLPTGADGALLVRSPTMFRGYLGDERATRAAFDAQGWFRTGDLAHVDADGMLHLTGRESDLVNRGGEKVPVAEVEGVLLARPGVAEAAVVAQPDPRLGERACAFVVPRPGAPRPTLADVRAWLEQAGITRLYWPEDVVVADALPRSATGKIDRRRLRELAAQRAREPRVQGPGPRVQGSGPRA
ncbi:MAG: AMP-binding protein, partial [Pseudoclavibacter sp.]